VAGVALGDIAFFRGRRGTWRHVPSFHVEGVALGDIYLRFTWQAWHLWHWACFVHFRNREPVRDAINAVAMEFGAVPGETFLRIMRMTVWRPDWGGASGASTAWCRAIAKDVCYRTVRQLWIDEHEVELQSMRLIVAEDRRKRRMLREGCPDSSDSD